MPEKANVPAGTISRTSAGLREMLFQQMEDIKSGKTDPQAGMAVAKLAGQIIASVRLEMDVAERMRANGNGVVEPPPLNLTQGLVGPIVHVPTPEPVRDGRVFDQPIARAVPAARGMPFSMLTKPIHPAPSQEPEAEEDETDNFDPFEPGSSVSPSGQTTVENVDK